MNLDDVIEQLYASISFERGGAPDWEQLQSLYAPGARMVRVTDDGVFEFSVDAYRANFATMSLASFWEGELWRQTTAFDDFAHVLSAYETRTSRDGEILNRGVNSIQLFQRDGRWWISAMLWRREGRQVRIPETALPIG